MNSVMLEGVSVSPSKVVCVGRNYVAHIKELNNEMPTSMVLFMKPNSAISHELNTFGRVLHYEGEISFLMESSKVKAVGFGLDLTDRKLQGELKSKGLPWERAKAFDGAGVFSDFVPIHEEDIDKLSLKLYINDGLVQEGGVPLMIYPPKVIIEEIRSFSSLEDGDIVMSGTPKGVGVIGQGDTFVGEIYLGDEKILRSAWIAK
ncbi:fumarylacetoacetate hydrolase family protein [Sulfurospirillum sp. 1612]|uniref:fumarylacetoacetate hydrolase family protein n=1 Tax=Sulfurospirillum sp. 1612 TaxID=3094835 RepID=UPI002F93BE5A